MGFLKMHASAGKVVQPTFRGTSQDEHWRVCLYTHVHTHARAHTQVEHEVVLSKVEGRLREKEVECESLTQQLAKAGVFHACTL